jgi:hypothetical protein
MEGKFSFALIVVVLLLIILSVKLLKSRKVKMNCYFDTNIFDRILESPSRDLIIKKIKQKGILPIPSASNLCEILSTSNEERKNDLIKAYCQIKDEYFPLKPYPWLLRESVEAVEKEAEKIEVNYHIEINKFTEDVCKELKSIQGIELEKYIQGARKFVQENREKIEIVDEKSFFAYADRNVDIFINIFNSICDAMGIKHNLSKGQILGIRFSLNMPWLYFLDAFLYIFFRRAIRPEGYSKKSNPQSADLEQVSYLFCVNLFVTDDGNFREFLKELKEIRGYKQEIFSFSEFMDYLELKE